MAIESTDLSLVARELHLPLPGVQRTAELLEEGNTVAFIARFRKDQTGGLHDEDIRRIEETIRRHRALAERKQTILKSIESQGKLTPELAASVQQANSSKILEDLYLPFRPRKQSLATQARQRGLEPFAEEILQAAAPAADLSQRATEIAHGLETPTTVEEVLAGVGHLLAEHFNEHVALRAQLRQMVQRTGKLVCSRIEPPPAEKSKSEKGGAKSSPPVPIEPAKVAPQTDAASAEPAGSPPLPSDSPMTAETETPETETAEPAAAEAPPSQTELADAAKEAGTVAETVSLDVAAAKAPSTPEVINALLPPGPLAAAIAQRSLATQRKAKQREKKRKLLESAFKDYFQFTETLTRLPPHRVLAMNRGERAKILRLRIEFDVAAMEATAEQVLIPATHPYADFLRTCLRDALSRLIVPSLEREARRELTERAEERALDVFVRNLRNLLLQQPVRGRRILAIDPGFRSGCKMVALDEFGNVLGHGVMHIVGKDEWRAQGRAQLVNLIRQHQLSVVAIGNGAGCRGTEQIVSEAIAHELSGCDVAYTIVNEAGTNEYSTSTIGREELPDFDPTLRSAISIGRRLLDPLSELVKINPANIGVGLYQHDMKLKHLRESLEAVVNACVNYVGVDVNTASPELLRHVSGLNQLTARRLYDYRREHGPFPNRDQLQQVPGFGEASFVQAAGFLRITDGDNPLDSTWIHPESYGIARQVLEHLQCSVEDLRIPRKVTVEPAAVAESASSSQDLIAADDAEKASPEVASPDVAVADATPADVTPADATPADATPADATPAGVAPADVAPPEVARQEVVLPAVAPQEVAPTDGPKRLAAAMARIDVGALSTELGVGTMLLNDILSALRRPGRDPRDDLPPPIFRRGIIKLEDLQPGMELSGTVLNVVDFGAFVDIGISDSGLVHISRLADRFVRDPHEVVGVGDVLTVWVVDVDKSRRRVSLTAIKPGTERAMTQQAESARRPPRPAQARPARPEGAPRSQAGPPPPRGAKPQQGFKRQGKGARPPKFEQPRQQPKKPKPIVPLTKAMEEGREPMRSFSDLAQFFQIKKKTDDDPS